MGMRHLRPANGAGNASMAEPKKGEYCLLDYSSCSTSDVCWLADLDNGCDARDNCIIDTS